MKKITILMAMFFAAVAGNAQLNPVTWSFSAVKVSDKMYEVHMKATIQPGWHLYSQNQPKDAIAIPTAFTFNPNPLVSRDGKVKELGKMEVMNDKELGVSANQYSLTVDFVQKVKLKSGVKTNLTGNV
ncbi:MAG: hypothetical protein AAB221_15770, partial [Bacteroidota bacterium]